MTGEYDGLCDVDEFVPRRWGDGPYWLVYERVGDKCRFYVRSPGDVDGDYVDIPKDGVRFLVERLQEFLDGVQ